MSAMSVRRPMVSGRSAFRCLSNVITGSGLMDNSGREAVRSRKDGSLPDSEELQNMVSISDVTSEPSERNPCKYKRNLTVQSRSGSSRDIPSSKVRLKSIACSKYSGFPDVQNRIREKWRAYDKALFRPGLGESPGSRKLTSSSRMVIPSL